MCNWTNTQIQWQMPETQLSVMKWWLEEKVVINSSLKIFVKNVPGCAWSNSEWFFSCAALVLTSALPPYLFHLLAPPLQPSCQRKVEISSNSYCFARNAPPPSSFPPFTLPALSCFMLAWRPHGPLLLNHVLPNCFYFAQWENLQRPCLFLIVNRHIHR